jgi:hypothetical protein
MPSKLCPVCHISPEAHNPGQAAQLGTTSVVQVEHRVLLSPGDEFTMDPTFLLSLATSM